MYVKPFYRTDGADRCQQQSIAYQSYGMACTEAELDVLTGEYVLRRADVLYDCGKRYSHLWGQFRVLIQDLLTECQMIAVALCLFQE